MKNLDILIKVAEEGNFFQRHKKTIIGVGAGIGAGVGGALLGKKMLGGGFKSSRPFDYKRNFLNSKKPLKASPNFKENFAAKAEQGRKINQLNKDFPTIGDTGWRFKNK